MSGIGLSVVILASMAACLLIGWLERNHRRALSMLARLVKL